MAMRKNTNLLESSKRPLKNIYTTTTEETINGKRVLVTHVVVNNPSQVNGAPANGAYGNGYETPSAAAGRLGATILVNGSHYTDGGREDLKGANNIVIVNWLLSLNSKL